MKKMFLILFFCFFAIGCSQQTPEEKIENMNGYWEIKSAVLPDGSSKIFKFSPVVDYIEVNGRKGFRKKVRPQIDGTYVTSESKENLIVKIENDSIKLYYRTPYNSWEERLLSSEEDELKIENEHGIIYTYKRFTPYLSNSDYGKENE